MMSMMQPVQKPANFKASFRRLLDRLAPERTLVLLVIILAVVSVAFAVVGPKILGNATNDIFNGFISGNLPKGVTKDQVVAGLRANGQGQLADMVAAMDLTPGVGIDFGALAGILILLIGVYVLSSLFSWGQAWIMAGVTQRTVRRLRTDVDEKLGRLPLKYFDSHPRGDVLSRVTNDIDNIGQSLQQSLTQLITSVLTIIGVLILMLTISPNLAVISILTEPVSIVITVLIASRSQQRFAAQWASTGALNAHVEEMHTGHAIVKVFGRQQEAIETGTDRIEMTARIGLIVSINTSTPTIVRTDVMSWVRLCWSVWPMLSMSLVTRLRMSPRGWLSK
jgi:ATP-binding cassette subfamily B multidrug efflux pump